MMELIIFLIMLSIAGIAYMVSPSFREECDNQRNEMYGGVVVDPEELGSTLSLEKTNRKYTVSFIRQSGNEYKPDQVYYDYDTMIREINKTLKRAKVIFVRIPRNFSDFASIHRSPYNYARGAAEGKRFGSITIKSELNINEEAVKFWYVSTYALISDLNAEDENSYNETLKYFINFVRNLSEEEKIVKAKEIDNTIRELHKHSTDPEECAKVVVKITEGIYIPADLLAEYNRIVGVYMESRKK